MLDEHVKSLDRKYNKIYFKKKYGTKFLDTFLVGKVT